MLKAALEKVTTIIKWLRAGVVADEIDATLSARRGARQVGIRRNLSAHGRKICWLQREYRHFLDFRCRRCRDEIIDGMRAATISMPGKLAWTIMRLWWKEQRCIVEESGVWHGQRPIQYLCLIWSWCLTTTRLYITELAMMYISLAYRWDEMMVTWTEPWPVLSLFRQEVEGLHDVALSQLHSLDDQKRLSIEYI